MREYVLESPPLLIRKSTHSILNGAKSEQLRTTSCIAYCFTQAGLGAATGHGAGFALQGAHFLAFLQVLHGSPPKIEPFFVQVLHGPPPKIEPFLLQVLHGPPPKILPSLSFDLHGRPPKILPSLQGSPPSSSKSF